MGKDSRTQKPFDKIKAIYFNFFKQKGDNDLEKLAKIAPEKVFEPHLSDSVAKIPIEDDEPQRLIINFDYFKSDVCDFCQSDSARMRSLLEKIALIGKYRAQQFPTCDLNPRPVNRGGDYIQLFNHLDEDVEKLFEVDISGYGRFYGFTTETFFYFVAVDTKHQNTH